MVTGASVLKTFHSCKRKYLNVELSFSEEERLWSGTLASRRKKPSNFCSQLETPNQVHVEGPLLHLCSTCIALLDTSQAGITSFT